MLKIIVNSSNSIDVGEDLVQEVTAAIEHRLGRFGERLTRIEAHIGNEDGPRTGPKGKRCMLEARPEGMRTLNVTELGATVHEAVSSAIHKLERMLDDSFQRLEDINAPGHRSS